MRKKTWLHDVDEAQQRLAALAERLQPEGEQDREEQHLQDLARREGADHGRGDDVHGGNRTVLCSLALAVKLAIALVSMALGSTFMPAPGCNRLTTMRPMTRADRGDDLEVDERLEADAPDLLHVLHAGDAVHDGEEDDRRDDHLDQLDEGVAERLHGLAERRVEMPEQHPEDDGGQDLGVEVLIPLAVVNRRCCGSKGHVLFSLTLSSHIRKAATPKALISVTRSGLC